MNPLHPNRLTADERISELTEILSLGLLRLRAGQSTELSPRSADSLLDSSPTPRMHMPHHPWGVQA